MKVSIYCFIKKPEKIVKHLHLFLILLELVVDCHAWVIEQCAGSNLGIKPEFSLFMVSNNFLTNC